PAGLLIVWDAAVGIEVLGRDLEIVAAGDRPVGLHESREDLHAPVSEAAIVDEVGLAEPDDGSGLQPAEDSGGAPAAFGRRAVVGGGGTAPPGRPAHNE